MIMWEDVFALFDFGPCCSLEYKQSGDRLSQKAQNLII